MLAYSIRVLHQLASVSELSDMEQTGKNEGTEYCQLHGDYTTGGPLADLLLYSLCQRMIARVVFEK